MTKRNKRYYIFLNGEWVGQTYAVSESKAISNYWWKAVKDGNAFNPRLYEPSDFEAVEA